MGTLETEARRLIGRRFERDGKQRVVCNVERNKHSELVELFWARPGKLNQTRCNAWDFVYVWLPKATEIIDPHKDGTEAA